MDADWDIRRLNEDHQWDEFRCGETVLDVFLQDHAEENDKRGVSRLWVATQPGDMRIVGYYASSAGIFHRNQLPQKMQVRLPGYPLPTIHMGRLAVDKQYQRRGLGEELLLHFLKMAIEVSERVGVFAVDLLAKNDQARDFYSQYGFLPLVEDRLHLFLPMDLVKKTCSP